MKKIKTIPVYRWLWGFKIIYRYRSVTRTYGKVKITPVKRRKK